MGILKTIKRVYWTLSLLSIVIVMTLVFNAQSLGAHSSQLSSATTTVEGLITSDTNWTEANSPYIVTGNVLVSEGVTLTVEPGVVVKFDTAKGMQVDGMLVARGTKNKQIVFTSLRDDTVGGDSNGDGNLTSPATGDWAYLFFTSVSVDAEFDSYGRYVNGSTLEYCYVAYGGSAGAQGEISIDSSAPFLNYTTVNNSGNNGIYVSQGTPEIANSTISRNNLRGVYVNNSPSGSEVTIVNNTVTNNLETGIYAYINSGTGTIVGNTVANNLGDTINNLGNGICASISSGTGTISNNTVTNNYRTGVSAMGYGSSFVIANNLIQSNSLGGIALFYSNALITNNIITNNTRVMAYQPLQGGGIYATDYGGYGTSNQTISNNVIACNRAYNDGALFLSSASYPGSTLTVSDNSIIGNTAIRDSIVHIDSYNDSLDTFQHNLLTQNLDSSSVSNSLRVNGFPAIGYNNLFNNFHDYEINNTNTAGATHVDAKNNWWGTSNETKIQARIFDWFDDVTKGIVDYAPYDSLARTDVPISPPTNLTFNAHEGDLTLSWNPNPEPDLAGYKIYYDADFGYPYAYSVDVGNVTTYAPSGLTPKAIFLTVTAYDAYADGSNDLFEGHESWYAYEAIADFTPPEMGTPTRIPAGDVDPPQPVKVLVNVTDTESGVKTVILSYTTDNGNTWYDATMYLNPSTNLFEAGICAQYVGTWVRFKTSAYDYAGNSVTLDGTEPYLTLPEFPSFLIVPLFMITTLLAVIAYGRKHVLQCVPDTSLSRFPED